MPYLFGEEYLAKLRNRCSIEEIIGKYVDLKRTGSSYVGLCPFHSERTASFHVSPTMQRFHCFGCQKSGDVITFIMEQERLSFVEAVKYLANMVGMEIPQPNAADTHMMQLRKNILQINKAAARFFYNTLFSSSGQAGREYFKKRGLDSGTITKFGLGYAPDSWHDLLDHLIQQGFVLDDIKASGLIRQGKKSSYDFFRDRVMFPIIDQNGNVVGFGGRALQPGVPAKYINSDESLVFNKRRNLYALNFAKKTKRSEFILCEGYMDAIALHRAGFDNAVAALGTAVTEDHARLIRRYTENVVLCLDSDGAGRAATQKALSVLPKAGLNVRVVTVTGGKDPDEMLREEDGKKQFERLLAASQNSVDYKFEQVIGKYDLSIDTERIECVKKLAEIVASLSSAAERDVYASQIANRLHITKAAVDTEVAVRRRSFERSRKKAEQKKILDDLRDSSDKINPDRPRFLRAAGAEEDVLSVLLNFPDQAGKVFDLLSEEDFVTDFNRRVFLAVREMMQIDPCADYRSNLAQYFNPEELAHINSHTLGAEALDISDVTVHQIVEKLKKEKRKITGMGFGSDDAVKARIESLRGGDKNGNS